MAIDLRQGALRTRRRRLRGLQHRTAHAYRDAWAQTGRSFEYAKVAVAVHGWAPMAITGRERDVGPGGMVFAGSPDEITERILGLHHLMGHDRQILQMDVGGMPHTDFLKGIELLGTEVLPRVRAALG